jgi:hypothetical protein
MEVISADEARREIMVKTNDEGESWLGQFGFVGRPRTAYNSGPYCVYFLEVWQSESFADVLNMVAEEPNP